MNRSRILILSSCFLVLGLVVKFTRHSATPTVNREIASAKPLPAKKMVKRTERRPFTPQQIAAVRGPASEWVRPLPVMRRKNPARNIAYTKLDLMTDPKPYQGLRGVSYAPGVRAIAASDFAPSMGEFLREVNGLTYFKAAAGQSFPTASNVVYDAANDRVFPLSSVLKISDASAAIRTKLLSTGHEEYYYSVASKMLYLTSSHETLFKDYNELSTEGYKVSVEVIRGQNRSR